MNLKPFFSCGMSSNVYLLEGKKNFLIDAGMAELKLPKIGILILTHCHLDHIAMAGQLQKEHDCEIWMSAAEAEFFEEDRSEASASEFFDLSVDLDFRIDKRLKDGEHIELGTTKLRVLLTPGHTPGGICLYEPESKTLFSGDTVFAQGYGRYDLEGGDYDALKDSISRLSKLDVKELYPGHGEALKRGASEYLRSLRI
jgi:glyoxylase-like metal-dependent hydrolase (beta-lactamase superfamily II)